MKKKRAEEKRETTEEEGFGSERQMAAGAPRGLPGPHC